MPLTLDPAAVVGWDARAQLFDLAGATMGTGWRVRVAAAPGFDGARVQAAIERLLAALVGEMSHWEAGSVLGRFNRAAAGSWTALPPAFAQVMRAGFDVAEASGGAFDPAIGRLVDAWGFGPAPRPAPPTDDEVAAARAGSGWRRLALDGDRLRQPGGVALDLSGIAKGFAVDAVADLLAGMGHRHCLVEIGGELAGRGIRPDGDPWWVELETPAGADVAPIRVALHALSVATSGDYVRGRHTIDPRTGLPVAHALAVSVVHPSAMLADAWATALGVVSADELDALATRHGLAVRALIRTEAGIVERLSPALVAMLD